MTEKKLLITKSIKLYSVRLGGAVVSFILHLYLMGLAENGEYGKFVYALSISTLGAVCAYFGIGNVYIRKVPNMTMEQRKFFNRFGSVFVFKNATIISLLCFLLFYLTTDYSTLEAILYSLASLIISISMNRSNFLRSMDKQVLAFIPECIIRPITNLVLFFILKYLFPSLNFGLLISITFFCSVLIGYIFGRYCLYNQFKGVDEKRIDCSSLSHGKLANDFYQTLLTTAIDQIPIIMSKFIFDFQTVGVVGFSFRLLQLANFGYGTILVTFINQISREFEKRELTNVIHIKQFGGYVLCIYYAIIAGGFYFIAPIIFNFLKIENAQSLIYGSIFCASLSVTYIAGLNYACIIVEKLNKDYIRLILVLICMYILITYFIVNTELQFIYISAVLLFLPNFISRFLVCK